MQNVIFVLGSVTTASKFRKAMESRGCVSAEVIHTPGEISDGGCSYSVRTKYSCLEEGRKIASEYNVGIKKVYSESGEGKKKYDNLS